MYRLAQVNFASRIFLGNFSDFFFPMRDKTLTKYL